MRQFKMAKGWAIFVYVTLPMFIALFGWLFLMPWMDDSAEALGWIFSAISLAVIGLCIAALVDVRKGVFVIDADKVYTKGVFFNRSLQLNEIRGFRVNEKYVVIEPIDKSRKQVKVSVYYERQDELVDWLIANYPDLDITGYHEEAEEILSNQEFGWTPAHRMERLQAAQKVARVLNWGGVIVGLWIFAYPYPFGLAVHVAMVLPLVAVMIMKAFKGLIRINDYDHSAYPTILWSFFGCAGGLTLRALFSFDIHTYEKVWLPSALVSLALMIWILIGGSEFKGGGLNKYASLIGLFLCIYMYSLASVIALNCMYDESEPEVYEAEILGKRVSTGKITSYYFEVGPWGNEANDNEVKVPYPMYIQLEVGDSVLIDYYPGKFDIPWLVVSDPDE